MSVAAGLGIECSTNYMKEIISVVGFNVASTCKLLVARGSNNNLELVKRQFIDAVTNESNPADFEFYKTQVISLLMSRYYFIRISLFIGQRHHP